MGEEKNLEEVTKKRKASVTGFLQNNPENKVDAKNQVSLALEKRERDLQRSRL